MIFFQTINKPPRFCLLLFSIIIFCSVPGFADVDKTAGVKIATISTDIKQSEMFSYLTVNTFPKNAEIRIMNIAAPYRRGIKLKSSDYQIEVSAINYKTNTQWYTLDVGQNSLSVSLKKSKQNKFSNKAFNGKYAYLTVESSPENTRIRLMNVKPKYRPGIKLKPGEYHIDISALGYRTRTEWFDVKPGKFNLPIKLKKLSTIRSSDGLIPKNNAFLFVNTIPNNAKIKIMDIKSSYVDGIELMPGGYQIEVRKNGYQTSKKWHSIDRGKNSISISLRKKSTVFFGAGDVFRDCETCPEMVVIPSGSFHMGKKQKSESKPEYIHWVDIKEKFALSTHEVTVEEYDIFANATGRDKPVGSQVGQAGRPVTNVTFADAIAYTKWLSQETNKNYRLPSEAEWEFSARAGRETQYSWGNNIEINRANCKGCGSRWDNAEAAPAGSFQANPFGLYDMHGNVWEWIEDCFHNNYKGAPRNGSARNTINCTQRILRGGSWLNKPKDLKTIVRNWDYAVNFGESYGIRIARTLF